MAALTAFRPAGGAAEKGAMGPLGARVTAGAAVLGLAALLWSCTTSQEVEPVGLALNQPVRTAPARAWRLVHEGTTLGYVVLFSDPADPERADRQFFSVRNPWQQDLGSVDGLGRAWRQVPHASNPEWVTTGSVLAGAAAILEAPPEALLEEIPLEALAPPTAR